MIDVRGALWLDLSDRERQLEFGRVGDIARIEQRPFVLLGQEGGITPAVCMTGPALAAHVRAVRAFRGLDLESGEAAKFPGIDVADALVMHRPPDVAAYELAGSVTEAARMRVYEDGPKVALVAGYPMDIDAEIAAGSIYPLSSDEAVRSGDDEWNVRKVVALRKENAAWLAAQAGEPGRDPGDVAHAGQGPDDEGRRAATEVRAAEAVAPGGAGKPRPETSGREAAAGDGGDGGTKASAKEGRKSWSRTKGDPARAPRGKAEPYPRVRFPAGAVQAKLTVKGDPMPARGKGGAKLVVKAGPAKGQTLWRGFATMPEGTLADGRDISGWRHDTLLTDDDLRNARAGEPVVVQFRPETPVRLWREAEGGRETMSVERPWSVARAVKEAREADPGKGGDKASEARHEPRARGGAREDRGAGASDGDGPGKDGTKGPRKATPARRVYPVRVSHVRPEASEEASGPVSAAAAIGVAAGASDALAGARKSAAAERPTVG